MISTSITRPNQTLWQIVQSYYQLTKPRIILLLLMTTASGMWLAAEGTVDPQAVIGDAVGWWFSSSICQYAELRL